MMRAAMSGAEPAGAGTIKRIDFAGQACAMACVANKAQANPMQAMPHFLIKFMLMSPMY
jgi:hypothetical protein